MMDEQVERCRVADEINAFRDELQEFRDDLGNEPVLDACISDVRQFLLDKRFCLLSTGASLSDDYLVDYLQELRSRLSAFDDIEIGKGHLTLSLLEALRRHHSSVLDYNNAGLYPGAWDAAQHHRDEKKDAMLRRVKGRLPEWKDRSRFKVDSMKYIIDLETARVVGNDKDFLQQI